MNEEAFEHKRQNFFELIGKLLNSGQKPLPDVVVAISDGDNMGNKYSFLFGPNVGFLLTKIMVYAWPSLITPRRITHIIRKNVSSGEGKIRGSRKRVVKRRKGAKRVTAHFIHAMKGGCTT